jgi:hypothetical protein
VATPRGMPTEREALLERAPPERQKLYGLVRQILDDLEEAAPWESLYYPPEAPDALLGMLAGLLGIVDGIPARLRELIAALSLIAGDEETRQTLEEAEFYYAGIHSMCARDLGRLRSLLEPYSEPGAGPPPPGERTFLCEVAADLKGKYASALMGATASIVAAGLWNSVETEPLLFPEKADEPPRNEALATQLRRTLAAIRALPSEVAFADVLERWRGGARVDPYALADLATFRGVLGQLLKRQVRRALYSGDYHQIRRREQALAGRIATLENLHDSTWTAPPETPTAATALYGRLVGLTLEIAAILDVDLLETLVGARAVRGLRAAASSDHGSKARRKPLPGELEPLVELLGEEDLKSYLELLLGSVLKRASFATERAAVASAPLFDGDETGELMPALAGVRPAAPPAAASSTAVVPEGLPAPVAPAPAAPAPAATQTSAAAAAATPGASPEQRRAVLGGLNAMLASLQAPGNAHYGAFRMLQRLVGRHTRLPPSMVQGAHPFFFDVLNDLVPQLEAAAAIGAVPAQARAKLVECCLVLTDQALTPERMAEMVPANLARLQRLLEGLTAATTAQLRAAGG